jgi:hypothetical protein
MDMNYDDDDDEFDLNDVPDVDSTYDTLLDELDEAFPECPFNISCVKSIEELDDTFTLEPVIFIHDDRANEHNWYYEKMTHEERNEYKHFLKVERQNGEPITLRQILTAMANDKHYNDEVVKSDPHCFLESFDKSSKSNIQYTMFWGS